MSAAGRVLLPLALVAAICAGCATVDRGWLAAASTTIVPIQMTVLEERVEGRSCGEPFAAERFKLAIDDALAKAPGANALVDVSYGFERLCMTVRGTAVRIF